MSLSEQAILAEMAKNDANANNRRKAVKKLKDQPALGEVAKNDLKTDIRIMALKRLKDQSVIGEAAKTDLKTDVRIIALKKLTDQAAIFEVAQNDKKTDIRKMALKKLTDPAAVFEVAKNDPNAEIRRMALKKMKKLTAKNKKTDKNCNINLLTDGNNSSDIIEVDFIESTSDGIFEKINSYIREIESTGNFIDDEVISNEIAAIKTILMKMTAFLKEENEENNIERRIERLDGFLNYYFPTIIKILGSYRQITEHGLDGGNALETKKRIIESVPVIRKAFEKELDNIYENKMLDITTDIDVLEAMLSKDGIFDNNNIRIT